MIGGLLLLWVGCLPAEEARLREAAERYDRGLAALERGQAQEALDLFQDASRLDPDSRVLVCWQAEALARMGRLPEALALLDQGLARDPEDADLRRSRASLRARAGRLEEAGLDLLMLRARGRITPAEAARDPDLRRLAERPELAALVAGPAVEAHLQLSTPRLLVGDELELELEIQAPAGAQLSLRAMGEPSGLLRRQRIVEDERQGALGQRSLRLQVGLRALRPGRTRLGPWLLSAGGSSALTEAVELEVLAVGQRQLPLEGEAEEELLLPSASLPEAGPPWLGQVGSSLVLWLAPNQKAEVLAAGQPLHPRETWELRRDGQPVARAQVLAARAGVEAWVQVRGRDERRRLVGPEGPQSHQASQPD